jgi:hypothetical protein
LTIGSHSPERINLSTSILGIIEGSENEEVESIDSNDDEDDLTQTRKSRLQRNIVNILMSRKKAKKPSKPKLSTAKRLRFTTDERVDSTNHVDVQIELGHQLTLLKQVSSQISQQRQQLNDIQQ